MPPGTSGQAAQAYITDANAGEFNDGMADGGHHAAYLTVAAFKDGQFHFRQAALGGFRRGADDADALGGLGRAVFQVDATAQNIQRSLCRDASDFCAIGFGDMVARMGQLEQKVAVVSEEDQALGIGVQPAYGAQHRLVAQICKFRHQPARVRV